MSLDDMREDVVGFRFVHTAKAASNGLLAAWLANEGFTGARRILEGAQGMAAGMSSDADPRGSPTTLHQSKFSMGTVLGLIAVFGRAGMQEFEGALDDPRIAAFRDKVKMAFDAEVDAAYPTRWIGKVTVRTIDGRTLYGRADPPLGDPASTLSRAEIGQKVVGLAEFSGAATAAEMRRVCDWAWKLTSVDPIGNVLTSA